jgi:hypothetical protein
VGHFGDSSLLQNDGGIMKQQRFTPFKKLSYFKTYFVSPHIESDKGDQQRVMTSDESLDQTLEDSFPASDPPGHFSKTIEDRVMHSTPYSFISERTLTILEQIPPKRLTPSQICNYTNLGCE